VVEILEMPQEGKREKLIRFFDSLRANRQKGKWATPSFASINPVKNHLVGFLKFEDVSFSYAAKRDILKNINFEVSRGYRSGQRLL